MTSIKYLVTCLLLIASSSGLAAPPTFTLPYDQWRMISLPASPPASANTVGDILGDNMEAGGDYGQNWVVYAYDTSANGYGNALSLTDTMEKGKGYWVIQNFKEEGVTLDMPANSTETPATESIPLAASKDGSNQWNLAGNPFSSALNLGALRLNTDASSCNDGRCNLDQAEHHNLLHNVVWTYNGEGYDDKGSGAQLNPWEGFWVAALAGSKGHSLELTTNLDGDEQTIGLGALTIKIKKNGGGIQVTNIKNNQADLLTGTDTELFTLSIQDTNTHAEHNISASSGWKNITMNNTGAMGTITLSHPDDSSLPETLEVVVSISAQGNNSQWDLNVSGLGDQHSLMDTKYPSLNIKAGGNDHFFVPYYHGKVFDNPLAGQMDYTTQYPRGWTGVMQYMAYYNDNHGLYFGMHDPKGSLKEFSAIAKEGGLEITESTPAANKTVANNTWELPGHFALELYQGDWYEAAMKYRSWVFEHADYRPIETPDRLARQKKIGDIALWVQESALEDGYTVQQLESHVRDFISYMDLPVGVAWTSFNGKEFDTLYPEIFPAREGLKGAISRLKNSYGNNVLLSGYMNGMLYDSNLASYSVKGFPSSVKNSTGNDIHYGNTSLIYMCPAQEPWQTIMADSTKRMTKDIGLDVTYIDMVTASGVRECYDPTHNHPLGGGSHWMDGYRKMFKDMHSQSKQGSPNITEGANDFLVDQVDAFLTIGFVTHNQVPALSAVYAGKVQIIGTDTGASDYGYADGIDSEKFYGRVAQSYIFGVQQGRYWMSLANAQHSDRARRAAVFAKKLAQLRVRLKDFFSFGRMLKPLQITGDIPTVTFPAHRYPNRYQESVVTSAIQTSTWSDGENVMIMFVNGKAPDQAGDVSFSFTFDSTKYGIDSPSIKIKEITEVKDESYQSIGKTFTKNVTLGSADAKIYIISPDQ
jgi:hypothetical protein